MNVYKIYQVRNNDEKIFRAYAFSSLDQILREHPDCRGELPQLPRAAWVHLYSYVTEQEPSLDWLFLLFNRAEGKGNVPPVPEDFTGHSMSVSDIVETPDGRLWFCDSLGWKEIQWEAGG